MWSGDALVDATVLGVTTRFLGPVVGPRRRGPEGVRLALRPLPQPGPGGRSGFAEGSSQHSEWLGSDLRTSELLAPATLCARELPGREAAEVDAIPVKARRRTVACN